MKHELHITSEGMELLHVWVIAHQCFLSVPEGERPEDFLSGLFFLVDEEVRRAVEHERAEFKRRSNHRSAN